MKNIFLTFTALLGISVSAVAGMSVFSGPNSGQTKPMPQPATNIVFNPPAPLLGAQGTDTNTITITIAPGALTATNSAQKGYIVMGAFTNSFASATLSTVITNSSTGPITWPDTGIPGSTNGTWKWYWISAWN